MNLILATLINLLSNHYGLDPKLTTAIIKTESNFDNTAVGKLGELGLMQIRPELFPNVNLRSPAINIAIGTWMLANAKKNCKHKLAKTFVVCYNAGIRGGSRLNYPLESKYYKRVYANYRRK